MHCVKKFQTISLRLKILQAYFAGMFVSLLILVVAATWLIQGGYLQKWDFADLPNEMTKHLRYNQEGYPVGFELSEIEFVGWIYDIELEGA